MDPNDFSEKLMKLSMDLQGASRDKQKAFAKLFANAKEALEKGYTQEEIQIIVVTAIQVQTNPQLKQLYSILMGEFDINPNDDFQ
jgi:alkylhydroperoxidase/carboxymuconolactone decarboxylase family protein YurZ